MMALFGLTLVEEKVSGFILEGERKDDIHVDVGLERIGILADGDKWLDEGSGTRDWNRVG